MIRLLIIKLTKVTHKKKTKKKKSWVARGIGGLRWGGSELLLGCLF